MSSTIRRLNRKQRRAGSHLLDSSREYIRAAAESLEFSDQQLAEAAGPGESADMLMARVIELLELEHGRVTPDCEQARAEMERRRGAGFVQRVEMDDCEDCKQRTARVVVAMKPGDVVQINPSAHPKFAGCFAVVDEVRSFGVTADIPIAGDPRSIAPVRLAWGEFLRVGAAPWLRVNEPDPLRVECPQCHAPIGTQCPTAKGSHAARLNAVKPFEERAKPVIKICQCGDGSSFDEFGNCSTCGGAVDPPVRKADP